MTELSRLETLTEVASVKTFLKTEIDRLQARKSFLEKQLEKAKKESVNNDNNDVSSGLGVILVNTYMWDQSNEYIKIYIEAAKEEKIDDSQLFLKFAPNSKKEFSCIFGKYRFTLANLYSALDDSKSTVKITKSNRVVITLYKSKPENWPSLNQQKAKLDELDKDSKDLEEDPSAGLMKMMKKMYDEGDDEMKRTIMKSWYESKNKSTTLPEM